MHFIKHNSITCAIADNKCIQNLQKELEINTSSCNNLPGYCSAKLITILNKGKNSAKELWKM